MGLEGTAKLTQGRISWIEGTHLFPVERQAAGGWSTPGVEPVVVETPLAAIGITICYDGDFPELYRCEAVHGAEVIVRPSARLRSFEIWEMTNKARAYDNHVYIAACNAIGPDAGGHYYFGHSMIISPIAQTLALPAHAAALAALPAAALAPGRRARQLNAAAALALLGTGVGLLAGDWGGGPRPGDATLTVYSANLEFERSDVSANIEEMLAAGCDVAVFQEVTPDYLRQLRAGLEGCYTEVVSTSRDCLLYTSPSPRDRTRSRMPSSA